MRNSVDEARSVCTEVLISHRVAYNIAATIADVLVESELRNRPTHGIIRLENLAKKCRQPGVFDFRILNQGAGWIHIDGCGAIGYWTASEAMKLAITRTRRDGLCLALVRNATHCGMLGYYVMKAVEADLVAVMLCDCRPRVAPHGATEAVYGTNPIAVGMPSTDVPFLLDMSTAGLTIGQLLVAERAGRSVDASIAFDANGKPTADPQAALAGAVRAFGGHKGAGLAMAIQLLSGPLTGAAGLPREGKDYGYFIQVVDPSLFRPPDEFKRAVAEVMDATRNARRRDPNTNIFFPGERAWRARQRALREGIEVDDRVWEEAQALLRAARRRNGTRKTPTTPSP